MDDWWFAELKPMEYPPPNPDHIRVVFEPDGPGQEDGSMWVVCLPDSDIDVRWPTLEQALQYYHGYRYGSV
jgi:hypothetical protein